MFLASACSCLCAMYWSQVLSGEWRCSWSSAERRCSNYIWVINNFIAYQGAPYIRDSTVGVLCTRVSINMYHTFPPTWEIGSGEPAVAQNTCTQGVVAIYNILPPNLILNSMLRNLDSPEFFFVVAQSVFKSYTERGSITVMLCAVFQKYWANWMRLWLSGVPEVWV